MDSPFKQLDRITNIDKYRVTVCKIFDMHIYIFRLEYRDAYCMNLTCSRNQDAKIWGNKTIIL